MSNTGAPVTGSSEGQTTNISSSVGTAVPKTMSADDLLEIYESEDAKTEGTEQNEKAPTNGVAAPQHRSQKATDSLSNLADKAEAPAKPEGDTDKPIDNTPKLKAKHGDAELEIPEEAVLEAEVNGKKVPFKVKDALRAVASQEEFNRVADKRLSYISAREQQHIGEVNRARETFEQVANLAAQGDHIAGLRLLAQFAGKDPVEYERSTLENLKKAVQALEGMTPEQREAFYSRRKAEHLQTEVEKLKQDQAFQREVQATNQKVLQITKKHGIDVSEFYQYAQELVNSGHWKDPNDITPEDVLQYHQDVAHLTRVDEAIRGAAPGMVNNEAFRDDIFKLTRQEGWSVEDIKEIISKTIRPNERLVENLVPKQVARASSNDSAPSDDELEDLFLRRRR